MNVLWCVVDCLRYDALSHSGYPKPTTEALDKRLDDDFVSFEDACTQSTFTLSVLSSLVTGTYPSTHGALRWSDRLSEDIPVVGDLIGEELGDVTAIPAMNFIDGDWGLERCFTDVRNLEAEKAMRDCNQARADEVCAVTLDLIAEEDPSVALCWFFDLHTPHLSDPPTNEGTPRERYDLELEFVAGELESLLSDLEKEGTYDETMVIITGDHGEIFDEHPRLQWTTTGKVGKHVPVIRRFIEGDGLLGHLGRPPVEELVHVPLYIKFPGQTSGGTSVSGQVELIDILPTILDQWDIDIPSSVQGRSLLRALEDVEEGGGKELVRSELIANPANGHFRMVRNESHKLIHHTPPELRDAREDPITFAARRLLTPNIVLLDRDNESRNIVRNSPQVARTLQRSLDDWPEPYDEQSRSSLSQEKREELENLGYL